MITLLLIALSWPVLGLAGFLIMRRLDDGYTAPGDKRLCLMLGWVTFAFSLYAIWDKCRNKPSEEDWRG